MLRILLACLLLLPSFAFADPDVTQPPAKPGAVKVAPKPQPEKPAPDALTGVKNTLTMGKTTRNYHLYVPSRQTTKPRPLIVVLHGGGGNAKGIAQRTGFTALANRENLIVAYPEGTGRLPTWNGGKCCGYASRTQVDDSEFIKQMIMDIRKSQLIDKDRIYATGFSNGGMLAYKLACDLGDTVAAVAVVGGAMNTFTCKPKGRPSILIIHAKNDSEVPYDGGASKTGYRAKLAGKPVPDQSVSATMDFWIKTNLCRNFPSKQEKPDMTIINYFCAQQRDLRLYTLDNGGHSWPGEPQKTAATTGEEEESADLPSSLPATEVIWEFFKQHPPTEVF